MLKIISQRKFIKGINASTGILSQQPGSIIRASNVLLTQRGSLQVCDGSSAIGNLAGLYPIVEWIDMFSNYMVSQYPFFAVMAQRQFAALPNNVTGIGVSFSGSGTNAPGTYIVAVVAIDGLTPKGHTGIDGTSGFVQAVATGTFSSMTVTWTPQGFPVAGYDIYLLTSPPSGISGSAVVNSIFLGEVAGASTSSFTFSGAFPSVVPTPAPQVNTTFYLNVISGQVTNAFGTLIIFTQITNALLPGVAIQPAAISPGDPLFSGSAGVPGFSPFGGIANAASVIPQSLQFVDQEVLILGNALAPLTCNPANPLQPAMTLSNTFQASYPNWQPGVSWITGNQLAVPSGGNNILFTATQGGVSGSTSPTWNFTLTTQTADGSVIWTSDGPIPASISPRGAAHAVVYAGSLWLFNTSPSTTSDNIDGPTCMKMSDSNNLNSWNPVNTAFVGKDDGTQITGAQPFTIAAVGISPTGSMAVFKEYQTYQVIGVFGSSNFEIQPAQTDMGCLAARSIQFIPGFGVMRYTHLGFAVYDGVNDRLVSEEIRSYLFGGIGGDLNGSIDQRYVYLSKSTQSFNPPMYMCVMPILGSSQLTKIFCYDLVMKSWVIIDLPSPISALNRIKAGEGNPLVVSGTNGGTIERLQAGDTAWSGSRPINWGFRTPDVFGEGASQKIFYREIVIRGFGTPAQAAAITIQPTIDGVGLPAIVPDIVPQDSTSNQFELRATIFMNGQICHLNISGQGQVVIDSVDWLVDPKAVSGRRVIG